MRLRGGERASRAIASGGCEVAAACTVPGGRRRQVSLSRRVPIPWVLLSIWGRFRRGWLVAVAVAVAVRVVGVAGSCCASASIGSSSGVGNAKLPCAAPSQCVRALLSSRSNPATDFSRLDLCRSIRIERPEDLAARFMPADWFHNQGITAAASVCNNHHHMLSSQSNSEVGMVMYLSPSKDLFGNALFVGLSISSSGDAFCHRLPNGLTGS